MTGMTEQSVTARDLLHLYLELRSMSPEVVEWSEERLADNPPRLVRLRQLTALFRAFGIPWSMSSFRDGSFIKQGQDHEALLQRAASEMPAELQERHGPSAEQLPMAFSILLRYREEVGRTLSSSTGTEASAFYFWALRRIGQLNETIRQGVQPIDEILAELISPDGKYFTLNALVQDFGYPQDDLDQIDDDWW